MKKTKNKLYTFGCSFTDPNFSSRTNPEIDCSFPKWPEILGKKLGLETVNLGKSGTGNDSIYYRAISSIINHHKEIDTICILWTNIWRYRIGEFYFNPRSAGYRDYNNNLQHKIESLTMEMIAENYKKIWENIFHGFLFDYQNLQTLCKEFDIRLVTWCGCSFLNMGDKVSINQMRKIVLKWHDAVNDQSFLPMISFQGHADKKFIDEKDAIGWPFLTDLGGDSYSDIIRSGRYGNHKVNGKPWYQLSYCISDQDSHPNAKGHELIAETFWRHMK